MQKLASSKAASIRDLVRQKKARDAERAFVMEGLKPIGELLETHPDSFQALVVTEFTVKRVDQALIQRAKQHRCPIYLCPERVFASLSDVTTPSGMLAVLRQPLWDQDLVFKRSQVFGFYGECLQDPANVGPMIRSAVAFGLDGLWLSIDSVDIFNPKVVRATAGALLKLPIFSIQDATVFAVRNCALLAAELPGPRTCRIQDITSVPPRAVVAFGNESRGLSVSTLQQASVRFHIPIRPQAESLNVASAAAIAAFALQGITRLTGDEAARNFFERSPIEE